ncbi:glycoside hydrolase [Streptomyces sp. JJ38]|nr:glycoside hydrolase [Streptomyces sp. JJ38]
MVTGGLTATTAYAALPPPTVAPAPQPSPPSPPPPGDDDGSGDDGSGDDGNGDDGNGDDGNGDTEGAADPVDGEEAVEAPAGGELEKVRRQIEALHNQIGSATDAYNAAAERARRQQRAVDALNRRVKDNEATLRDLRNRAGAMARAQYRGGGFPVATRLTLADDPEAYIRSLGLLRKGQRATSGVIGRLDRLGRELADDREAAADRHTELEDTRKKRGAAKKRIEAKLKQARKLESSLAAEERARLRELEEQTARARQLRWLKTGVLEEINGEASERGKKAVTYALAQLGKDYEWGAEGPETFDCSGLTLRAWEAAEVPIPRTSQEQWRQLERVDIADMRPGDLIIYKEDASHVGMYLGDGEIVHAPRTGRQIRVEGAGSLPILGVVRPDA